VGGSVSVRKRSMFGRCPFRHNKNDQIYCIRPEEFPYFCLSPADKEAPEISNNKLPYHTKNTFKRMRTEEKPTRCHCMLYCTYDMLNIFRALPCPSSGALDYMCVIAAYGVQCSYFRRQKRSVVISSQKKELL